MPVKITKYIILAILSVLAVLVVQRIFFPSPPKTNVVTLREAPATQILAVVGRSAPTQSVNIRPEAPGRVSQFLADEGSVVAAGQVIAYIDAGEQFAAVERANADVAARSADASARAGDIAGRQGDVARQLGEVSARRGELAQRQSDLGARRADVARFQADLAGKRATADLAARELRRTEILAERGFASRAALDSARASAASARAGVATANASIRSGQAGIQAAQAGVASAQGGIAAANGAVRAAQASVTTAGATARSAQASVTAARAGAREAQTRARRFAILAPMAGTILARPIDSGQIIDTASILFVIGSGGAPEIETEIDEADADKLRIGTQAVLSPTGSALRISARITEISPQVDTATGGRIVRLVPNDNFAAFPPGRTIDVNIIISKRDRALLIPRTALIDGNNVLTVTTNGRVSTTPINFLEWSGEKIAVNTGLKAGDRVIVSPLDLKNKTRVKPVELAP